MLSGLYRCIPSSLAHNSNYILNARHNSCLLCLSNFHIPPCSSSSSSPFQGSSPIHSRSHCCILPLSSSSSSLHQGWLRSSCTPRATHSSDRQNCFHRRFDWCARNCSSSSSRTSPNQMMTAIRSVCPFPGLFQGIQTESSSSSILFLHTMCPRNLTSRCSLIVFHSRFDWYSSNNRQQKHQNLKQSPRFLPKMSGQDKIVSSIKNIVSALYKSLVYLHHFLKQFHTKLIGLQFSETDVNRVKAYMKQFIGVPLY